MPSRIENSEVRMLKELDITTPLKIAEWWISLLGILGEILAIKMGKKQSKSS